MPVIKNPQREAFALCIARGEEVTKSYAAVYPGHGIKDMKTLSVKASRLHTQPVIQARIAEMKEALSVRTHITQQRVLEELAKIGFSNAGDMVELGSDGKTTVDISKLSSDQKAAISEIQIETDDKGKQRVRVKLHDKRAALMDIGKHLGMFREKIEVTGKDGGAIEVKNRLEVSLLDREEREMLKQMLLAIAERKAEREGSMRTINHQNLIEGDDAA
ncbi:Terminase small subunit [uncultured Caudovirales phage]|uniref:Terminase small subunit n=1 Tax=uncultured Caudovirales phage TaxID=2100421 RepID=A0A6J5NC96_9CAUD|nr:Terminase small subunit [uncultured Caudovirales phage]